MPKIKVVSKSKEGKHVATFITGNEQHLHSLSLAPDLENFLSADESKVNLWHLERSASELYNLVDYNRTKCTSEDEAITSIKFSTEASMFLYTTSKGHVRICDLRESSNFHTRPTLQFQNKSPKASAGANVFDKWLNVISDATFVPGTQ